MAAAVWVAESGACVPPIAMGVRRMGHPGVWGWAGGVRFARGANTPPCDDKAVAKMGHPVLWGTRVGWGWTRRSVRTVVVRLLMECDGLPDE